MTSPDRKIRQDQELLKALDRILAEPDLGNYSGTPELQARRDQLAADIGFSERLAGQFRNLVCRNDITQLTRAELGAFIRAALARTPVEEPTDGQ